MTGRRARVIGVAPSRRRDHLEEDRSDSEAHSYDVAVSSDSERRSTTDLLRRGRQFEVMTLSWNVVGVVILAYAAIVARSVALAGFGVDSVIEIGASAVVLWELADAAKSRQKRAMRMIGASFLALAVYLVVQSTFVLVVGFQPHHSPVGITWTALTAVAMVLLALGKSSVGRALQNPVLTAEGRVTLVDAILAGAVLIGLVSNVLLGWWWADPTAGYVILFYAIREAREALRG